MKSVLRGVKVVEQGTFITGPCAGMMLADLGADVIKIESPGGDPYRAYQGGLYSPHFQAYNRNKRSIVCDLKQPADRELFERLIADADVYIQNFRPGTAEKLGAGPARLRELNPRLVYCSISGFGGNGPYVERPSYDSVAQALSGFLSVVVDADRPRFLGPALADAITGIYARLRRAGRAARARRQRARQAGRSLHARGHGAFRRRAVRGVLRAGLGAEVLGPAAARAGLHPAHRRRQAHRDSPLVARKILAGPGQGARGRRAQRATRASASAWRASRNYEALGEELDKRFRGRAQAEWCERLQANDVPFAPINGIDAVVEDPQVGHLGLIVPVSGAQQGAREAVRPALQFDGERAREVSAAPLLDQHGAAIRAAINDSRHWPANQEGAPQRRATG